MPKVLAQILLNRCLSQIALGLILLIHIMLHKIKEPIQIIVDTRRDPDSQCS